MERSTEEKEEEETGPVTSLMVSPAKPSSQALSPIRKAANPRDREETSSGQVHSAVVVKSSEENVSVRPKKRRQVVQSGSAISGVSEGMPEPSLEEQLPHNTTQAFTSNVVWNFEDLHMLNGTNLPIFGEGTHPCVSLRLHDMNKPINILTGIDYWLDNLMCYVPEVRMYHLDGIVQKCQLIKTEDLPHTAESQFSLHLVRDVAQNILAFLNRKVTKEGHTYWLFKEKDDDIVKLYDLTSLCAEGRVCVDGNVEEESGQGSHQDPSDNPFTVPVAILFYRVAKNMSASEDAGSKIPTIRALLSNTLSLLDNHQYPKIVSSAHYMLSDLYVPQDVDPDSPTLSDCSEDESEWLPVNGNSDGEEDDEINKKRSRTHPHYYKAPSLQGSLEERCLSALDHATQALRCLHSSTDTNSHILLLKKISLIYLVMARANYNNKEYGLALQYLRFSFHAWQGMTCRLGDGTGSLPAPAQALTLAGDIFYMMAMHWQDTPKHVDAYNTVCDIHQEMLTLLDNIISAQECCGVIKLPCDVEEAFSLSLARLEDAIATSQPEADIMLLQRLGNVCKEIGVMYLLQSNKLCEESDVGFEELSRRSREFLDRGLAFYTRAQDKPNTALLYYFSGSLLRVRAFHHTSRGKLSEKHYYQQALKEYQRGLEVLVHRSQGEEIWDLVVLDYCDAHYAFASILHHRSTHSAKVPREAVDLLNKALKYCDENNTPGPSQPLYRDRAAVIYRKLAGIYRDALRHSRGDKRMRYLVELNYKKAAELFLLLENPVDIMELQLDRMALLEEQIQGLSSPQTLYRLHLSMLQLLVECQPALKLLQPITTSTTTSSTKARPGQQKTLGGEEEQSAKDNVEKAGDDVSVQGQSHTTTATNTTTSPTNTITLATAATTPTPTLTTSSSTTTPEVENRPIPPPDITSDKEGGRPKSVMESQAQSEKEGLARLEKDEDQAKSEDLLEMLQKKLHASLWALIKVTKNGGTGADGGIETLKQMYKESLNADSLPLPSHLLSAITAITPLLETLPHIK
ncbi:hypothetical protein Pmani_008707 [Petrolisthes manimaculis]|uniref:Erythroid differentiation-related factor 1 n=1 Tax=Petrolisthes manimaculis TaxID=1843537 RepID=A0AAE1UDM1_9EUCA|nr:hypothetical protein Pmani_008707 [Petrolisthes manimaculis]